MAQLKEKLRQALNKSKSSIAKLQSKPPKLINPVHTQKPHSKKSGPPESVISSSQQSQPPNKSKKSSKVDQLKERLSGGQFRWLNEKLYTTDSRDSFSQFSQDPSMFESYHKGFRVQASSWPINPLEIYISTLTSRFTKSAPSETFTIADMGCGDAVLAQTLLAKFPTIKIHSFDLVAGNSYITACDIANVPLERDTCDLVIFCLSLMGTNLRDFIVEANRVLQTGGALWITEVQSRLSDETKFVNMIVECGFKMNKREILKTSNHEKSMFISFEFRKKKNFNPVPKSDQSQEALLKPCIYKKR